MSCEVMPDGKPPTPARLVALCIDGMKLRGTAVCPALSAACLPRWPKTRPQNRFDVAASRPAHRHARPARQEHHEPAFVASLHDFIDVHNRCAVDAKKDFWI